MSLDLDAIKTRCESVPEGPWESDDSEIYGLHRDWLAESLHINDPRLTAALWEDIDGATLEYRLAHAIGTPAYPMDEFTEAAEIAARERRAS